MSAETVEAGIQTRNRIARRAQKKQSVKIIQAALLRRALGDDDLTTTVNAVRDQVEELCALADEDLHHNDFGSAVTGLRCAGVIASCGYADHSTSPRAQGNRVRKWRVTDPNKAYQFFERLRSA